MTVTPRQANYADIPQMHRVRLAVRENRLTSTIITEEDYKPLLDSIGRGWVIEEEGKIVGFSVGNHLTGNIWALFVHPDYEGRGYGSALQKVMVDWLFSKGLSRLYLATEVGTRAQRFYEATGWKCIKLDEDGEAIFERFRS